MLTYGICALLLLISAASKGVQDSIAHRNSQKSRGLWWDQEQSWRWKYAQPMTVHGKPRFPGSKTWLVFVTDAWHFFGMVNMNAWQAAICLLLPLAWYWQLAAFAVIKVLYGLCFEVVYTRLNKSNA